MAAKILIPEAEYHALKKSVETAKKTQNAQSANDNSGGNVQQEISEINKELVEEPINQRLQELNEQGDDEQEGLANNEPAESEEDEPLDLSGIVHEGKEAKARAFLSDLVQHPDVALRRGTVLVDKKKVGHLVMILYWLFGQKKPILDNLEHFQGFVKKHGLAEPPEKKTKVATKTKATASAETLDKAGSSHKKKKAKAAHGNSSALNPTVLGQLP